jgi:hypothetical protein
MMTTNETLEFITKLKEIGVIYFEDKNFKVTLNDKTYQPIQTAPFVEQLSKESLDDELFNQGI